jgi:inosine/xanthosine triphosphatase
MKINVASKNPVKVEAVKEVVALHGFLSGAVVSGFEAKSGVSNQPTSIEEIKDGATNRAIAVFKNCDFSFGIESGFMGIPSKMTKTEFVNITVCVIYDGTIRGLGLSSGFVCPPKVTKLVIDGMELDEAYRVSGLTNDPRIGRSEGIIGHLTGGKLSRKNWIKEAVQRALVQLENPELYKID